MNLGNGRQFGIEAKNLYPENQYVEKVTLNGESKNKNYLPHKTIMQGGEMTSYMAPMPGEDFGKGRENLLPSLIFNTNIFCTLIENLPYDIHKAKYY